MYIAHDPFVSYILKGRLSCLYDNMLVYRTATVPLKWENGSYSPTSPPRSFPPAAAANRLPPPSPLPRESQNQAWGEQIKSLFFATTKNQTRPNRTKSN